jgi:hypothetical protein
MRRLVRRQDPGQPILRLVRKCDRPAEPVFLGRVFANGLHESLQRRVEREEARVHRLQRDRLVAVDRNRRSRVEAARRAVHMKHPVARGNGSVVEDDPVALDPPHVSKANDVLDPP